MSELFTNRLGSQTLYAVVTPIHKIVSSAITVQVSRDQGALDDVVNI